MATVYVTGHRNPDTDSIASAIGYAELKGRLDPRNEYVPSRLGELNAQTRWVLDRSGAPEPELLPHVLLRVRDVMLARFPTVSHRDPIRQVGLTMARQDLELMPIVDDDGALAGVMTERTLARRYIRESREVTSLADAAATVEAVIAQLDGELVSGDPGCELAGRVWVLAMDVGSLPGDIGEGDVVVVGNRDDAQRRAIELGVALLVTSNGTRPTDEVLALAQERGTTVVSSPWDSYVSSRMVTLSAPCRALMDSAPLTARPDDLVADISAQIPSVDYRAAVAIDSAPRPARRRAPGGGARPRAPAGRRCQPRRARLARAAQGAARRPCRAGPERRRGRARRDRRDPRPPPRRLDGDDGAGARDVRPGRLDGHARHRALPPERDGADARDRDRAARRRPVGPRDPQLADHDRARPRRRRVPRARARARRDAVRPRDVREHIRRLRGRRGVDRHARRQGVRRRRRPEARDRPDRDGRRRGARAPRRAARRAGRAARGARRGGLRAHGHRHPRQGHEDARRRGARAARARVRSARRRWDDRPPRRDEPQEAGRAEAAAGAVAPRGLGRRLSR